MMGSDPLDEVRGSAPLMTTKDVILEMRSDLKKIGSDVIDLKRDQALVSTTIAADRDAMAERRVRMFEARQTIEDRLDNHEHEIKGLNMWKNEAAGALRLARWALGTSLLATCLLILDIIERFGR